jgi:N-methylhydantoinase A
MTDLRRDYIRTQITRTDQVEPERLNGIYVEMEEQAQHDLAAERVREGEIELQRFADMRYTGQEHTVKVPLPADRITAQIMPEVNERFHTLHEQTYTFRLDTPVELVNFHITALGRVAKPEVRKLDGAEDSLGDTGTGSSSAGKGIRSVNFDELGFHEASIYERDRLPVGVTVQGPIVVEEPASTTVVFPDQGLTKDEYGFLHIEMVD